MITYVDTSTLLRRLLDEDGSVVADAIWNAADVLASASVVLVEARAALAAALRDGRLTASQHRTAKLELGRLVDELTIVSINDDLIAQAAALAEKEALRGYDAVHLAAALAVGANVMASADVALCEAAGRQGLAVANPLDDRGPRT